MFQKDLSIVEKLVTDVAKQTLVMMALDMSGASNMINNDPNMVTRNLKRGFAFYLGHELEEEVLTQQSNLRTMDWRVAVDDSFFNAVISAGVEQSNLNDLVSSVTSRFLDPNSQVSSYVTDAIIISGMRYAGTSFLGTTPIRHISSMLSVV